MVTDNTGFVKALYAFILASPIFVRSSPGRYVNLVNSQEVRFKVDTSGTGEETLAVHDRGVDLPTLEYQGKTGGANSATLYPEQQAKVINFWKAQARQLIL